MTEHTTPAAPVEGTRGTLSRYGTSWDIENGAGHVEATYIGRVPSPWVNYSTGNAMPDLYLVETADGERIVFEHLRSLLVAFRPTETLRDVVVVERTTTYGDHHGSTTRWVVARLSTTDGVPYSDDYASSVAGAVREARATALGNLVRESTDHGSAATVTIPADGVLVMVAPHVVVLTRVAAWSIDEARAAGIEA